MSVRETASVSVHEFTCVAPRRLVGALCAQLLDCGIGIHLAIDFALPISRSFKLWVLRKVLAFRLCTCPGTYISLVSMQNTGLPLSLMISIAWRSSLSTKSRVCGYLL